jgi:hypothetical protein
MSPFEFGLSSPPWMAYIVGQEMKRQLIAILVIVALVGAMTFVGTRFAFMGDVSHEDFDAFIRDNNVHYRVDARQTSHASALPIMFSIRFPKSDTKGGLGFPDRTDVYTLASNSGVCECHVHVRQNRVCLVTFAGSEPPSMFRESLVGRFPKLSIQ